MIFSVFFIPETDIACGHTGCNQVAFFDLLPRQETYFLCEAINRQVN